MSGICHFFLSFQVLIDSRHHRAKKNRETKKNYKNSLSFFHVTQEINQEELSQELVPLLQDHFPAEILANPITNLQALAIFDFFESLLVYSYWLGKL